MSFWGRSASGTLKALRRGAQRAGQGQAGRNFPPPPSRGDTRSESLEATSENDDLDAAGCGFQSAWDQTGHRDRSQDGPGVQETVCRRSAGNFPWGGHRPDAGGAIDFEVTGPVELENSLHLFLWTLCEIDQGVLLTHPKKVLVDGPLNVPGPEVEVTVFSIEMRPLVGVALSRECPRNRVIFG